MAVYFYKSDLPPNCSLISKSIGMPHGKAAPIPSEDGRMDGSSRRTSTVKDLTTPFAERLALKDYDPKRDPHPAQDLKRQRQNPSPSILSSRRLFIHGPDIHWCTSGSASRSGPSRISKGSTESNKTILPPTPPFQRRKNYVSTPAHEECQLAFLPENSPEKGKAKAGLRKPQSETQHTSLPGLYKRNSRYRDTVGMSTDGGRRGCRPSLPHERHYADAMRRQIDKDDVDVDVSQDFVGDMWPVRSQG